MNNRAPPLQMRRKRPLSGRTGGAATAPSLSNDEIMRSQHSSGSSPPYVVQHEPYVVQHDVGQEADDDIDDDDVAGRSSSGGEAAKLQDRIARLEAENARLLIAAATAPAPPFVPAPVNNVTSSSSGEDALRRQLEEAEEQIFELSASMAVIDAEAKHEVEQGNAALKAELAFKSEELQRSSRELRRVTAKVKEQQQPMEEVPAPDPPAYLEEVREECDDALEALFDPGTTCECRDAMRYIEAASPEFRASVSRVVRRSPNAVDDLYARLEGFIITFDSDDDEEVKLAESALEVLESLCAFSDRQFDVAAPIVRAALDLCERQSSSNTTTSENGKKRSPVDPHRKLRLRASRFVAAIVATTSGVGPGDVDWWAEVLVYNAAELTIGEAFEEKRDEGVLVAGPLIELLGRLSLESSHADRFDAEVWPALCDGCRRTSKKKKKKKKKKNVSLTRRLQECAVEIASCICLDEPRRACALLASRQTTESHRLKKAATRLSRKKPGTDWLAKLDREPAPTESIGMRLVTAANDALDASDDAELRDSTVQNDDFEFAKRVLQLIGQVLFLASEEADEEREAQGTQDSTEGPSLESLIGYDPRNEVLVRHELIALCERILYASSLREPGAAKRDAELVLQRLNHPLAANRNRQAPPTASMSSVASP